MAQWLSDVEAKLPLSTFKTLAVGSIEVDEAREADGKFFMSCYHRIALSARAVAKDITHPNLKPGTVDVDIFCRAVRDSWAQAVSRTTAHLYVQTLSDGRNRSRAISPLSRLSCFNHATTICSVFHL